MSATILQGDCRETLRTLPESSAHCCVTSPPYFGLRDYGCDGQIGLEETPDAYVAKLAEVFREVRRVLRDDGTLWLNLGDSYAADRGYQVMQTKGGPKHGPAQAAGGRPQRANDYGLKPKDLIGIPWRVAFALQADGWWLRQDIIWHKPNPMPESVTDRCTKAHEYIFLLSKSARYYFDVDSIREPYATADRPGQRRSYKPGTASSHRIDGGHEEMNGPFAGLPLNDKGRNRRSVWTVTTKPYKGAHFATFPPDLIRPCILAGCPAGGTVLDAFGGSGTTGQVAIEEGRQAILCELNPAYVDLTRKRLDAVTPSLFGRVAA